MLSTVTQQLAALGSNIDKEALRPLLAAMADRMSSLATTSAGLVISTGGTTALDTATTVYVSPVGAFDATITI